MAKKKASAAQDTFFYYQVLGLLRDATPTEVEQAHRRLVVKYHPDKNGGEPPDVIKKCTEMFLKVRNAYKALIDPTTRATYDSRADNDGTGHVTQPAPSVPAGTVATLRWRPTERMKKRMMANFFLALLQSTDEEVRRQLRARPLEVLQALSAYLEDDLAWCHSMRVKDDGEDEEEEPPEVQEEPQEAVQDEEPLEAPAPAQIEGEAVAHPKTRKNWNKQQVDHLWIKLLLPCDIEVTKASLIDAPAKLLITSHMHGLSKRKKSYANFPHRTDIQDFEDDVLSGWPLPASFASAIPTSIGELAYTRSLDLALEFRNQARRLQNPGVKENQTRLKAEQQRVVKERNAKAQDFQSWLRTQLNDALHRHQATPRRLHAKTSPASLQRTDGMLHLGVFVPDSESALAPHGQGEELKVPVEDMSTGAVVIGKPGAGKTTVMMQLLKETTKQSGMKTIIVLDAAKADWLELPFHDQGLDSLCDIVTYTFGTVHGRKATLMRLPMIMDLKLVRSFVNSDNESAMRKVHMILKDLSTDMLTSLGIIKRDVDGNQVLEIDCLPSLSENRGMSGKPCHATLKAAADAVHSLCHKVFCKHLLEKQCLPDDYLGFASYLSSKCNSTGGILSCVALDVILNRPDEDCHMIVTHIKSQLDPLGGRVFLAHLQRHGANPHHALDEEELFAEPADGKTVKICIIKMDIMKEDMGTSSVNPLIVNMVLTQVTRRLDRSGPSESGSQKKPCMAVFIDEALETLAGTAKMTVRHLMRTGRSRGIITCIGAQLPKHVDKDTVELSSGPRLIGKAGDNGLKDAVGHLIGTVLPWLQFPKNKKGETKRGALKETCDKAFNTLGEHEFVFIPGLSQSNSMAKRATMPKIKATASGCKLEGDKRCKGDADGDDNHLLRQIDGSGRRIMICDGPSVAPAAAAAEADAADNSGDTSMETDAANGSGDTNKETDDGQGLAAPVGAQQPEEDDSSDDLEIVGHSGPVTLNWGKASCPSSGALMKVKIEVTPGSSHGSTDLLETPVKRRRQT